MASANKQQKRATRAKAKAKQNRTQRAAAPVELDPNDDLSLIHISEPTRPY